MLPSSFFDSHWCVVLNTKWWFSEKWHTIAVDSSAINFGSFTSIEPSTTILGGSEVFVGMGSTINLTCVIRLSPEPPSSIRWQHNNQVSLLFFFFFFQTKCANFMYYTMLTNGVLILSAHHEVGRWEEKEGM